MKNEFEKLYEYLRNYVVSSADKHAALTDINHVAFVLHAETEIERQIDER
jgi:3',5'-cyclic AMP phosphodiesterase CpdA